MIFATPTFVQFLSMGLFDLPPLKLEINYISLKRLRVTYGCESYPMTGSDALLITDKSMVLIPLDHSLKQLRNSVLNYE